MLHARPRLGSAIHASQRRAGDFESNESGSQHAQVSTQQIHLEGPSGPPKLFLAPAKGGGAPPDARGVDGASAPSAASPSELAGGRRMSAGKGGPREGGLH